MCPPALASPSPKIVPLRNKQLQTEDEQLGIKFYVSLPRFHPISSFVLRLADSFILKQHCSVN